MTRDSFYSLPGNLPVPQDDGACDHLSGAVLPNLSLRSTDGRELNLAGLTQKPTVFFFYPRTGRPDEPAPVGWDEIAGARGCTPQSCGYRDLHAEFREHGVQVFGISTQTTDFQQELVSRVHLPFEVLSDSEFTLTEAMKLPTFEFSGMRLLKRMAWYCERGKVAKVFYPVFPSNQNADTVLAWLKRKTKEPTPTFRLPIDSDTELTLVDRDHAPEVMALIDGCRPYLRQWLGWLDRTRTLPELLGFVDSTQVAFAANKGIALWIKHRAKVVGIVHLGDIDSLNRKAMIGYWVGEEFRGRGFAKKATRALCDHAFRERGLNRIEIRAATGNTSSQSVPTALGFQREGVLRDNEWLYDHFVDHVVFSMVARDWE